MFQRLIEGFRDSTGNALRQTSIAIVAALALVIATAFLCAAGFIAVLQKYGPIEACLAGAGVFLLATLIAMIAYALRKRQAKRRAAQAARRAAEAAAQAAASNPLADPMLLAMGLQLVRAVGIKKLVPILALAGVALGVFASRSAAKPDTDEEET
jgi:threonine/homoserine/homoserine lactone efflux protein